MATIRKLCQGWNVQIRKKGTKAISKTFTLKKDAEAWARKIESEIDRGLFLDISEAQHTTLKDVLNKYVAEILPSKKSQHSVKYAARMVIDKIGYYSLSKLNSQILSDYRDGRLKEVGNQTVAHELQLISRVLNLCTKDWGIHLPHGNPVANVRMPKLPQGRTRRLQAGEESKLCLALVRSNDVLCIFKLALETAMRRSELVNIEWSDIDFKNKTLHIPKTKTAIPRTIPLSSKALDILKECKGTKVSEFKSNGLAVILTGKVFNITESNVSHRFNLACKRAGIEGLHFHDLRHEAVSRLFERGLNPMEVASISGHQDLKMLRRYTHIRPECLVDKLG